MVDFEPFRALKVDFSCGDADMKSRPRDASQAGSVLLEFSICLGFLLMMSFGVAGLGITMRERIDIVQIARLAARAGANESLGSTPSERANTVAQAAFVSNGIDPDLYHVVVTNSDILGQPAVTVTIEPIGDAGFSVMNYVRRSNSAQATFLLN